MTLSSSAMIQALWAFWLLRWAVAAIGAKETQCAESAASRASHHGPLLLGASMMACPSILGRHLEARLLPQTPAWLWLGVALVALGIGFAIAAPTWLGANWSAIVTL
jgi:hypothetical protein